jgi:hypothetical protein
MSSGVGDPWSMMSVRSFIENQSLHKLFLMQRVGVFYNGHIVAGAVNHQRT